MAYTTLAKLRTYLGVTEVGDDTLLTDCITRATAVFDAQFPFSFEAETETRYFIDDDIDNDGVLWLDKPLLTVTTLTNGDASATVIAAADYWLQPRNESPYWYIKLKDGGDTTYFEFTTDGEISIAGTWGYMTSASGIVEQCVTRLAAYFYRQKDSQTFDVTAVPELGIMTIPSGIPNDVKIMIESLQAQYVLA